MYIIGITGASGAILGIRLIEELLASQKEVAAIVTNSAWKIIHYELFKDDLKPKTIKEILIRRNIVFDESNLKEYKNDDFFSPPASGSFKFQAIIVMPCSMKTLAAAASGFSESLLTRAIDVAFKENRQCILAPRETPLNLVHLTNMLKVKQAGADVLLPVPSFYTFPETIDDVINYIIGKTLNLLGIENKLFAEWG